MPIVNTAELTGEALNWAVGKAEGLPLQIQPAQYGIGARVFVETPSGLARYRPVLEWMQCGPLLEKMKVSVLQMAGTWEAVTCDPLIVSEYGDDPRTAICLAVVSAVSGPTVDVPGELF